MKISEVFSYLKELAPLELQMDFDNSGFLIGHRDKDVKRVLLSLDVTPPVVQEAVDMKADLIITHHPVIFRAIKSLTDVTPASRMLLQLVENQIAVISMHTNLDIVDGGVNDALIGRFPCTKLGVLDDSSGCGRYGEFEKEIPLKEFLALCKTVLNANGLRFASGNDVVKRIAFMGGSGAEFIRNALEKGCDTYVTADIKYHDFLYAAENNLTIIDADHFCTENVVISVLHEKLKSILPDDTELRISTVHKQTVQFYTID